MNKSDVSEVVSIHNSSWSPEEVSVKLGPRFQYLFYTLIAEIPYACTFVYECEGKIIGYTSGFLNYSRFNRRLLISRFIRLVWIILTQLLIGKLRVQDLVNLVLVSYFYTSLRYPIYHLGATALRNEYKGTTIGRTALKFTSNAVLDFINNRGGDGCWGVCDKLNIPMRKWYGKLGFEEVGVSKLIGREVVYYEKEF